MTVLPPRTQLQITLRWSVVVPAAMLVQDGLGLLVTVLVDTHPTSRARGLP
jgi:hypothetical protein